MDNINMLKLTSIRGPHLCSRWPAYSRIYKGVFKCVKLPLRPLVLHT